MDGGVDAVFDGIGGAHLDHSFQGLRKGGRLVSHGLSALPPGMTFRRALVPYSVPHLFRLGVWWFLPNGKKVSIYQLDGSVTKKHPEWIREDLSVLLDLLARRKIAPVV